MELEPRAPWLAPLCTKRGEGSVFGAGGVGRKGQWCDPAAVAGPFVTPDLCGAESREIVNSVRDAEGC